MSGLVRHRGGSGEPLVLLHGLGSHGGAWRDVVAPLEAEREVFVIDLPGFGRSPAGPASVPGLADALEAELDRLGLDAPHFAGNSLGGWLSLELARRGRARTVVALSPAGLWSGLPEMLSRLQLFTSFFGNKLLARAGEAPLRDPRVRRAIQWAYRYRGERSSPEHVAEDSRALASSKGFLPVWRWTLRHQAEGLEEIDCPVVIAWGEHDRLLNKRQGPRFVARIPRSELRLLPGVGHLPMSDDPELVVRTILEFQREAAVSRPEGAAAP